MDEKEQGQERPADTFRVEITGLTLAQARAVLLDWPEAVVTLEED